MDGVAAIDKTALLKILAMKHQRWQKNRHVYMGSHDASLQDVQNTTHIISSYFFWHDACCCPILQCQASALQCLSHF